MNDFIQEQEPTEEQKKAFQRNLCPGIIGPPGYMGNDLDAWTQKRWEEYYMQGFFKSEIILPDNYPVFRGNKYLADGETVISTVQGTVGGLKGVTGAKEIRCYDVDYRKLQGTAKAAWRTDFIQGEAQAVISEVLKFIDPYRMNGLDIGSNGNPIFPQAISMDSGRGDLGPLIQVHGDARDLSLFKDSSLDYVFSSHCWEDFSEIEKPVVLAEWVRVIKENGFLILYLPDEQRYRACCAEGGNRSNPCHKDADFSLDKTRMIVQGDEYLKGHLEEIYSIPVIGYSFFIVFKRKGL